MKKCNTCKKIKKETDFWKDKKKKDGTQNYCKECVKKAKRISYLKNPEIYRQQVRNWRKNNPEKVKEIHRKNNLKLRMEVLNAYSNGKPKCKCCGEKEIKFLAIDHINNDGNKERKKLKFWGYKFYLWLKRNNFPQNGYQVLCHNCNMAKGFYKICPHQQQN